jgi:hypothetical protein
VVDDDWQMSWQSTILRELGAGALFEMYSSIQLYILRHCDTTLPAEKCVIVSIQLIATNGAYSDTNPMDGRKGEYVPVVVKAMRRNGNFAPFASSLSVANLSHVDAYVLASDSLPDALRKTPSDAATRSALKLQLPQKFP